jgi:hypothetical protein
VPPLRPRRSPRVVSSTPGYTARRGNRSLDPGARLRGMAPSELLLPAPRCRRCRFRTARRRASLSRRLRRMLRAAPRRPRFRPTSVRSSVRLRWRGLRPDCRTRGGSPTRIAHAMRRRSLRRSEHRGPSGPAIHPCRSGSPRRRGGGCPHQGLPHAPAPPLRAHHLMPRRATILCAPLHPASPDRRPPRFRGLRPPARRGRLHKPWSRKPVMSTAVSRCRARTIRSRPAPPAVVMKESPS